MDLGLVVIIALVIGIVLGWFAATHIHQVASAATRATTVPSGDVDKLNAAVAGLGTHVQALTAAVAAPAITAAVAAAKPITN